MLMIEPLAVTKKDAFRIVGMPKLVQRWLHYGWVEIVRKGGRGRETIIDFQSLKRAYELYRKGEEPPPLPSEARREGEA
jgi:hypothetical protein